MNTFSYIVSTITTTIFNLITGQKMGFLDGFTYIDITLIVGIGMISSIGSITYSKAIIMESPGRLGIYRYSATIMQFIYDLIIFHTDFSPL